MNPKIARDPFFAAVAERWGEDAVWEAGFFEDEDPADAPLDDVGWLCTPTAAVRASLAEAGEAAEPVVLVATGGFWPPHHGHVALMERAREAVEADGRTVVGGYLSPGHDDYLRLKWGGAAPPAAERLAVLRRHVAERPWLDVDPWEALHRTTSVNFTDVVTRLERFLRAQVDERIRVVFVCGGDNARFALAFAARGSCVVVGRPGAEAELARWRADPRIAGSDRVVWAEGGVRAASSTMGPPPDVVPEASRPRPTLRLRMEDGRAVAGLGLDDGVWRAFQTALTDRLALGVDVIGVPIEQQPAAPVNRPTISLDPMTPGTVDVGVSRLFDCGGARHLGYVARPGSPPVEEQLAGVSPGSWTLFEDDRMSGGTLRHVRERLAAGVEVVEVVLGMAVGGGEIADSRDFLLGADHGGLVIELPDGSIGRAPYLLPYVDPFVRCGVPAADILRFSRDVWALNAAVFEGTDLRVSDLHESHRRVLGRAGHPAEARLAEVCRAHAAVLSGLLRDG